MPTRTLPALPGFEILKRIGRGAGATISLAIERGTRKHVAIKQIIRRDAGDDRFIAQAESEYEIAHGLNHVGLRKYFDVVRIRKWLRTQQLFLIMEYVDGETLESQRPEKLELAIPIFSKVADALHAMHMQGFAHADIKPNNILLTYNDSIKIIDFGQSCPLGHRKKRVQGTPDYMAPEQVMRQPIDQRTDIFNLGATMYWVVTGKWFRTMMPAAPAGTSKITLESSRGNAPPHELNAGVPTPLSKLIMDCCETNRERRPRDMREVKSRLEVALHLLNRKPDEGVLPETFLDEDEVEDDGGLSDFEPFDP